jgi:hypothetical protein
MSRLRCLAIAASLALWIAPVQAHELPVDLELVIAIDASSSIERLNFFDWARFSIT